MKLKDILEEFEPDLGSAVDWNVGDVAYHKEKKGTVEAIVRTPIEHEELFKSGKFKNLDRFKFHTPYVIWENDNNSFKVSFAKDGSISLEKESMESFVIWDKDDTTVILEKVTNKSPFNVKILKNKGGKILKGLKGNQGLIGAGVLGAFAHDNLKRYKDFKTKSNRSLTFYARNTIEKKSYEKMIKQLLKSGQYKQIRSLPFAGGARMWELRLK